MNKKTKQIIAVIAIIIAIPVVTFSIKHYFSNNKTEADFIEELKDSSLSAEKRGEMIRTYIKENQRSEKQQKKLEDERKKDEEENPPSLGQISNWQKNMSNAEILLDSLLDHKISDTEKETLIEKLILELDDTLIKTQTELLEALNDSSISNADKTKIINSFISINKRNKEEQKELEGERKKDEEENPIKTGQTPNWLSQMTVEESILDNLLDFELSDDEKEKNIELLLLELELKKSPPKTEAELLETLENEKISKRSKAEILNEYVEENQRTKKEQKELDDERKKDEEENPVGIGQSSNWQKGMSNEEYILDALLNPELTKEQRENLIDKFLFS